MTVKGQIEFVIVGGSVAGLCAAYTLRQSGHDVVVLDKRDELADTYGGLRVPPNMTRLLESLPGMKKVIETHGNECEGMTFLYGDTSKVLGRMLFVEETMEDLGCKFHMIPYDILIRHLIHLCRQSGVRLEFRTEVASADVAPGERPSVLTTTGKRFEGDVLVGADGRSSIIRDLVHQTEDEDDDSDSDSCSEHSHGVGVHEVIGAAFSIRRSTLKNDPELFALVNSNEYMVWPGSGILVTGHKCGPEHYILTGEIIGAHPTALDLDWDPHAPFPDVEAELAQFEPRVTALVKAASHCHQTIQRFPVVRRLTNGSAGIVVIGDAAHTIPIHETHNASIAVEDGFALGRIFSYVTTRDQIPYLLSGYREVRQGRSTATELSELRAIKVITLPPGPARDSRNAALAIAHGADDMSDEHFAAAWEDYIIQFNYDAQEAVDEWWLMAKFNIPHATNDDDEFDT
ncbi:hypothetical protein DFH06DRAFT_1473272 [Mycena polygramma]|nr:hypothetical protein DFH06DRAFT_1473272 [Mycena polygramma]